MILSNVKGKCRVTHDNMQGDSWKDFTTGKIPCTNNLSVKSIEVKQWHFGASISFARERETKTAH